MYFFYNPFFFQSVEGQQVETTIVSGRMVSREGEPLPGVNILIKGTNRGTISDLNGYYSIEAPVGATLVISYIGFMPYEIKVRAGMDDLRQRKLQQPANGPPLKPFPTITAGKKEQGVAVLSDSSAGYEVEGFWGKAHYPLSGPIARIKLKKKNGREYFEIVPSSVKQNRSPKLRVEYSSAIHRTVANKLPELQKTYAQGSSVNGALVARGPDQEEVFSWGPAIADLSVSPSGDLLPQQNGLAPARAFDPYRLLRAGVSTENNLQLFSEVSDFQFGGGYGFKSEQGIIPANNYNRHSFNFNGQVKSSVAVRPRVFFSYSRAHEQLPQRGANLATILGSIYTTPPTYDLLQGVRENKPWKNSSTYLDPQRKELSYAPRQVNHPYWLINHFPDKKKEENILTGIDLKTDRLYPLKLNYKLVLDRQNVSDVFGIPPLRHPHEAGRLTDRRYHATTISSNFNVELKPDHYSSTLDYDFNVAYLFNYKQESLRRQDGTGFAAENHYRLEEAENLFQNELNPFRRQHELVSGFNLFYSNFNDYRFIHLALSNRFYFSNTLQDDIAHALPAANLKLNLKGIDGISEFDFLPKADIYASFASSLQEAPLLYNQFHHNVLLFNPGDYRQYYESEELVYHGKLLPENHHKWEFGTRLGIFEGLLDLDFNYYRNKTNNFILPVHDGSGFQLKNVATVVTPGLEAAISTYNYFQDGSWSAGFTFSRSRPRVESLYDQEQRVPIAGFQTVNTNLIEGQPVGVLVGSRYRRNSEGSLVIGPDGFPLTDPSPRIIGNPNPDWLAGMHATVKYKGFGFYFLLDGRKGGDVWNGTQQFLNYYGVSRLTADEREQKGYVFKGVTVDGDQNQQPVDFYDPANPLLMNRWIRNGVAGVAEDGVEEASFIRINEIQLNYDLSKIMKNLVRVDKVKVSLLARNILLFTTYSGLDPAANLFGYQQARGLDLFNQPNTRSYGAALTLNF